MMIFPMQSTNRWAVAMLFAGIVAAALAGCRSTAPVARVSQAGKEIELYDVEDEKSSIADVKQRPSIAQAIDAVNKKLKDQPNDVGALVNLANLMLVQGRIDDARSAAKRALSFNLKHSRARKVLAAVEIADGNLDLASIILNGLGGAESNDSQILNMLGLIALRREQYGDSLAHFKAALKANENDIAVRMNLGTTYLKYRQLDAAKSQFEKVLAIMPDHQDAGLHVGIIAAVREENVVAEKIYSDIVERNKKNSLAWYNLALVQRKNEAKLETAIKSINNMLDIVAIDDAQRSQAERLRDEVQKLIVERDRRKREAEQQALAAKKLKQNPAPADAKDKKPEAATKKDNSNKDKR